MHVTSAVVIVMMEMPPFLNQFQTKQAAENNEHDADDAFRRVRKRLRNRHTKREDNRPYQQQHDGVPHTPTQAHQTGGAPRWPFGEYRRNRCKMIRI
jgi:hypothetical protein